jgi:hypothetical protein
MKRNILILGLFSLLILIVPSPEQLGIHNQEISENNSLLKNTIERMRRPERFYNKINLARKNKSRKIEKSFGFQS